MSTSTRHPSFWTPRLCGGVRSYHPLSSSSHAFTQMVRKREERGGWEEGTKIFCFYFVSNLKQRRTHISTYTHNQQTGHPFIVIQVTRHRSAARSTLLHHTHTHTHTHTFDHHPSSTHASSHRHPSSSTTSTTTPTVHYHHHHHRPPGTLFHPSIFIVIVIRHKSHGRIHSYTHTPPSAPVTRHRY